MPFHKTNNEFKKVTRKYFYLLYWICDVERFINLFKNLKIKN